MLNPPLVITVGALPDIHQAVTSHRGLPCDPSDRETVRTTLPSTCDRRSEFHWIRNYFCLRSFSNLIAASYSSLHRIAEARRSSTSSRSLAVSACSLATSARNAAIWSSMGDSWSELTMGLGMSAPVRSAPLPSIRSDRRPTLHDRPNIAARHTPNDHLRGVRDALNHDSPPLTAGGAHNRNGFHPARPPRWKDKPLATAKAADDAMAPTKGSANPIRSLGSPRVRVPAQTAKQKLSPRSEYWPSFGATLVNGFANLLMRLSLGSRAFLRPGWIAAPSRPRPLLHESFLNQRKLPRVGSLGQSLVAITPLHPFGNKSESASRAGIVASARQTVPCVDDVASTRRVEETGRGSHKPRTAIHAAFPRERLQRIATVRFFVCR